MQMCFKLVNLLDKLAQSQAGKSNLENTQQQKFLHTLFSFLDESIRAYFLYILGSVCKWPKIYSIKLANNVYEMVISWGAIVATDPGQKSP